MAARMAMRSAVAAAAVFLGTSAVAGASAAEDFDFDKAVMLSDECVNGDAQACALNEMQLRASRKAARSAESATVTSGALPLYCQDAASSPWCQGTNMCSCQMYCTLSVPPANWGWDPNCCNCQGSANVAAPPPSAGLAPPPKASSDLNDGEYPGLTHPVYCENSPIMASSPYCQGENTCSCGTYCHPYVMPQNWGYDPNCCGCSTTPSLNLPGKAGSSVDGNPEEYPMQHPRYCAGLAAAGINSPYCNGPPSCGCQTYCTMWTPSASWGWDPNCCGCSLSAAPTTPMQPGMAPLSGEPAVPGVAAAAPVEVGPLTHPAYCTRLPPGITLAWCTGANSCSCQTYCTMSVAPTLWGEDPNCCGCSTASQTLTTPPPGADAAGGGAPVAGGGSEAAPVAYEPMKHPRYCGSIPAGMATPAWCAGENSCGCQTYCIYSVAPTNWGWDPNCCGCSTEKPVEAQPKAAPSAAAAADAVPPAEDAKK